MSKIISATPLFSIIIFPLLIFLIFCVGFLLLKRFINESNANKYGTIGTILAALVGMFALFFIGYQSEQLRNQIKLQTDEFHLEHRPYLYIHLPPDQLKVWYDEGERAWFGGGNLRFRNVGKDPASIIKTKYMIASDTAGEVDFVAWFERDAGGFPDIKNVFPGQEDAQVPCHPEISTGGKRPKLLYIGAVISYVGPSSKRAYWYKFSQLYVIRFIKRKNEQGRETEWVSVVPLKPEHDWDKNTDSEAPTLKEPEWKDYLSKTQIKALTGQ